MFTTILPKNMAPKRKHNSIAAGNLETEGSDREPSKKVTSEIRPLRSNLEIINEYDKYTHLDPSTDPPC